MNNRIKQAKATLSSLSINALLVSSLPNIFYFTNFTGFSPEEREAYLLLTKHTTHFFTTKLYIEEVKKQLTGVKIHTIGRDEPFVSILKSICEKEAISNIGFEEHDIRYFEYQWLSQTNIKLAPLTLSLRRIKTSEEIEMIQKACTLGDQVMEYIVQQVHTGVTEIALADNIEIFFKQHQAESSFTPIVAFGANAAIPHHKNAPCRFRGNEFALFDLGAKVSGYCSDMTRTIFFGKPTNYHKKVYQTVLDAQKKAVEYIDHYVRTNKEVFSKDVDTIARDHIVSQGFPSLPHSLGHGIGIEVHEAPRLSPISKESLREGMVFSVEPGIYIPKRIGIRIEDLVTITSSGVKILTHFPKKFATL